MIQNEASQYIPLQELNDTFIDGTASISLSMIPATKGSLLGITKIKGESR